MAKDDKKPISDVAKPGSTPPDSSSKPIIVSRKPAIKDPMVNEENNNDSEIQKLQVSDSSRSGDKVIEPSHHEEAEATEDETDKSPDSNSDSDNDSKSEDSAVVDAVISQAEDKKKKVKDAEEQDAKNANIEKLIESKKYFVKVKSPKDKRNKRTLLIVVLIILLALGGVGAAADAELIPLNVPFDFIKKTEPKVAILTEPVVESKKEATTDTTLKQETYVIPDGYVLYENKDLGFKFVYPKEWAEFKSLSTYGEDTVEAASFYSYFVSTTPSTQILPGVNGPFTVVTHKTQDQTFTSRKYGPDVQIKDNKLVVTKIYDGDTNNVTVGAEYNTIGNKPIKPVSAGNLKVFPIQVGDEGCISYKLVFIAKNRLNKILLPDFCDNSYGPEDGTAIIDPAQYNDLETKLLSSIRDIN